MLLDQGVKLVKLGVTVPDEWIDPDDIKSPAIDVIRNPKDWPADEYYASTIHVVRKFLGPSAQPAYHQLWAEAVTDQLEFPTPPDEVNRALIMHYFRNDRELGETVRAARGLAFDAGFYCGGVKHLDPYSPDALRGSRYQTMLFPFKVVPFERALKEATDWGCIPVYLRPLPESEIENAMVGRPHFWRLSGSGVDLSELAGKKFVLVASQEERLEVQSDDINLSIPLANSPSAKYQMLSTINVAHATSIAMVTMLNATQDIKLTQPTGLRPSHPEIAEGRMVSNDLSKILKVPRLLTQKQMAQRKKKLERREFEKAWEEAEEVVEQKTRAIDGGPIEEDFEPDEWCVKELAKQSR